MTSASRILAFCGKGGVGKTTLSLAFALKRAAAGQRVLVVTSHPLSELALSISLEGLAARFPEAAKGLFIIHIDPRDLIAETVREHFPIRMVAEAVLSSSIFHNLIEIAPGLKEFFFLTRLQGLAERKGPASEYPQYDLLVWDAPASGHFLSMLKAGREFETYLSGPLASSGAEMNRFFSSKDHLLAFPVTTLEEMAIAETTEMAGELQSFFELSCTGLLLNAVSPLATATEEEIASLPQDSPDQVLRFAIGRGRLERERTDTLKRTLPLPQTVIPRITNPANDLDLLTQIGDHMEISI